MSELIIVTGLSFAGKSTLGEAIVSSSNFKEVDVDHTKRALYGRAIKDEDLTHDQWVKIYSETDNQIVDYLKSGESVIDASRNFRRVERDQIRSIVEPQGFKVVTVYVDTPEDVVRQRWLENAKNKTRHHVTDKDFEEIIKVMEPPTEDENPLVFHYGDDMSNWISQNITT